ncbi:hypothetical protein [Puia dinghuensis]|uniref:DUF4304 domain-containing protein n=1 Tax=Puia dinghuensis TaxID=1792502 RepID=A0A8J2UHG0_9BACT|nr:hypothetical protein [Puia dinghuensis]GGB17592.1 hypothetical protein GCM10011511_46730 [Puia dinghuensis]
MMKLNDVTKSLIAGMTDSLQGVGFQLDVEDKSFQRVIPGGKQIFYLIVNQRKPQIIVEPWWGIRLDKIVDIYHHITLKKEEFFPDTYVFENNLGGLIYYMDKGSDPAVKSMKFVIESPADVDTLVKVIPIRFKQYVLPYFNENSSVERADALLNEHPRDLSPHNWIYPLKATMGLIAARLVKNPDYYQLRSIYEEELAEANPTNKEEFEKLKVYLETI